MPPRGATARARFCPAFQLVKGHVYCLRGPGELIALDGDTGAVDWSFSAPSGQINPNFLVGADRTILQVDKPNQLLVLRTDDGQPTSRTTLEENERLAARAHARR